MLLVAIDEPGLPPELLMGDVFFDPSGFLSVKFEVKVLGAGPIPWMYEPAFLPELDGSYCFEGPPGETIL